MTNAAFIKKVKKMVIGTVGKDTYISIDITYRYNIEDTYEHSQHYTIYTSKPKPTVLVNHVDTKERALTLLAQGLENIKDSAFQQRVEDLAWQHRTTNAKA